jgi:CubicO group peptidase (beta-lactamase class C family)
MKHWSLAFLIYSAATLGVVNLSTDLRAADADIAPAPKAIQLDDAHSDLVLGDYTIAPKIKMTISREDGHLYMQIVGSPQPRVEIGATADTEFFMKKGSGRLSFIKDSKGKVTSVILHQTNAPDQKFPRAQSVSPAQDNSNSGSPAPSDNGRPLASTVLGESKIVPPLDAVLQQYHVPALAGVILDSTGVKLISVTGIRKKGEAANVTIDDVWRLGSTTKALTATMIAALVEQKKLSWDSNLAGVFPELGLSGPTGQITLLQLLTHRAGLPANADWGAIAKTGSRAEQRKAAVANLAALKLMSPPGSRYIYSNWGYVIAGAMAEQVTGKTYEELMQSLVFGPLQMKSAGFSAGPTPGSLDAPWGHDWEGRPSLHEDLPVTAAAGSTLSCSLADWGKFISDHLRGAEGKPALLRPDSYARLHSAPFGGTYALGWMITHPSWGGGEVLEHTGTDAYNYALVLMAPARDLAILTVCNAASELACRAAAEQLMALASLPHSIPVQAAVNGEVERSPAPSSPTPTSAANAGGVKLDDAQSDPILGDYDLPSFAPGSRGVMRISRESGNLFMQIVGPGQPPKKHELEATSATELFAKNGGARLRFVKDSSGKVTSLILRQKNAPEQEFPRVQ